MSMLRQLKEKFLNINNQTLKWVRLQDQLLQRMEELLSTIQHSGRIYLIVEESAKDNSSSSIMSNDEKKEILIGLRLVRKQIKLKYYHKKQNITIVRHDFLRFDSITNDFTKLLTNYRDNLEHTDKIIKQLHSNTSTNLSSSSDVINVSAKQLINSNMTIKNNIITNIKALETILSTIDQLKTKSNNNNTNSAAGAESKNNMITQNEELIIRIESNSDEEVIQNVKIVSVDPTCIISSRLTISSSYNNSESLSGFGSVVVTNATAAASSSSTTANDTTMVSATLIAIDSSSSWTSPINNLTSQSTSSSSLILCIPPSEIVSSILLQSGFAINNNNDNNDININKHSSVVSRSNHSNHHENTAAPLPSVELPCGISLASLEPRVELTSNALGDVIDWTILLKSSAPEKFLKRPPVRFLFDLIRYIGDTNDGFLDSTLAFADWATVGVDKASKILFMDNVSSFSLCIDCSWIDVCVNWVNMH